MSVLTVSFEIHYDDDKTYNALHKALNDLLTSQPITTFWCETTSYYVVQTEESAAALCRRLATGAKLRKSKDRLVVLDANIVDGASWGAITDDDLYALLPFVQKL